jgi:type VI secretion system protein ImpL
VVPWEPGAPARLGLRWATESELRPSAAGLRGARVQDRTVTWAYGGEWSLLRLLRQNAAPPAELGGSAGRARQTLRFQVATLRGAPGDTLAGPAARVYVRLRLLHPDTREELAVPVFPTSAPFMRASRAARSD